jgi:hypothetical protein
MSVNYTSRAALRKLKPEVFEKAAELVKNAKGESAWTLSSNRVYTPYEGFSCLAIHLASGGMKHEGEYQNNPHNKAFAAYFAPDGDEDANDNGFNDCKHPFWNNGLGTDIPERSFRRYRQERVNALLMMAAVVRQAKS